MGLVSDVKFSENSISFSVQMKNAAMHARKRMEDACAFAVERKFGKGITVKVNVQALKKSEAAQSILPNVKNTIAIVFW